MKGLLIKDFMLLKNQMKFFGMAVLLILVFLALGLTDDSFVVMYATVIFSMFTLSSISYDEYENGATCLFALPISRSGYVREKYVFGLLLTLVPASVTGAAVLLAARVRSMDTDRRELLVLIFTACFMSLLIQAVMIPIQLKFGGERSRTALFLVVGAGMVAVILVLKGLRALHIDLDGALRRLETSGALSILAVSGLAMGILLLLSVLISIKIMKRKEF